jgi:hypothetical protein
MRIRICQQVFQNLSVTGLWALITAFIMIILPMPAVATPVIFQAVAPTSSLAMPAIFWQSKDAVKGSPQSARSVRADGAQQVLNAYQNQQSNIMVENVSGTVEAILPDDLEGSRHQRFIIQLEGGQTVLIVHNVDVAPRIRGLQEGDRVSVKGEYEWNDRGGLIHWTHKDPRSAHEDGWIEHNSIRYE